MSQSSPSTLNWVSARRCFHTDGSCAWSRCLLSDSTRSWSIVRGISGLPLRHFMAQLPRPAVHLVDRESRGALDRKSTRLNSSHANISYAVFCLKKTTYLPSSRYHHQYIPLTY